MRRVSGHGIAGEGATSVRSRRDADSFLRVLIMMNLYSGTTCPFSHRCRIVLYEKGWISR
jgi:hypothetical protein